MLPAEQYRRTIFRIAGMLLYVRRTTAALLLLVDRALCEVGLQTIAPRGMDRLNIRLADTGEAVCILGQPHRS